ncbi:MAG: NAD(P)-dependent oxidoreductase [Myxococcota bacterium]|nr:NAD(P)-dependent oxidoreductase [Myxococcota bacterium]
MKSLVTGSSGLLGKCLVERLEARGDELSLLDLEPPPPGSRHAFHRVDACNASALREAAGGCEVIYHLAAAQRMKPQFSKWTEKEIFERNLDAVRKVLDVAAEIEARKVIFVSSSGVYGQPQCLPVGEDHATKPLGEYGRSKLLAEEICLEAIENRGLDVTMFRPMSLFGPGMTGIFAMLFEWVRTGAPVFMLGSGANRVQAVSAGDVADACVLAATHDGRTRSILNLGSDPASVPSVEEMVTALVAHAGTRSPVVKIPSGLLRNAARALHLARLSPIVPEHYILADSNFILDIGAAREDLGWAPQLSNIQMTCDAYDSYLAGGAAMRPTPHPILRILDAIVPHRV